MRTPSLMVFSFLQRAHEPHVQHLCNLWFFVKAFFALMQIPTWHWKDSSLLFVFSDEAWITPSFCAFLFLFLFCFFLSGLCSNWFRFDWIWKGREKLEQVSNCNGDNICFKPMKSICIWWCQYLVWINELLLWATAR